MVGSGAGRVRTAAECRCLRLNADTGSALVRKAICSFRVRSTIAQHDPIGLAASAADHGFRMAAQANDLGELCLFATSPWVWPLGAPPGGLPTG